MLITLYGINNVGKTTQAKRLVEKIKSVGKSACYLKYPVYDLEPSGLFLDKVLRSKNPQHISEEELQMWFTLNRFQYQPALKDLLREGFVIAEDYTGTGIAWGVAKGADKKWLEELNKYLIKGDLAILMNGKRQMKSKEDNHIHERDDVLVEKCADVFRQLAFDYGWEQIDVRDDWDETTDLLWRKIEKFL